MANVVITGGSRGIGAAAVKRFAELGHRVWFLYAANEEAAKAVEAESGARGIRCDVSDGEAVKAAFRSIGDVDILVCAAGIAHYGLLSMTDEDTWDRLFNVNVKGIYHCVNAAMPSFLKKQAGCVITVSSMWGQVGASCEAAYSAAKAGVIGLTKALAKEVGPSGIRVNCIAPGMIDTDMNAAVDPEIVREIAEETPLCRTGRPSEVAKAMVFLASENSSFITGQIIGVNGGLII
jgi:3-oxoacyl-[acyl-carrier protein] reductase